MTIHKSLLVFSLCFFLTSISKGNDAHHNACDKLGNNFNNFQDATSKAMTVIHKELKQALKGCKVTEKGDHSNNTVDAFQEMISAKTEEIKKACTTSSTEHIDLHKGNLQLQKNIEFLAKQLQLLVKSSATSEKLEDLAKDLREVKDKQKQLHNQVSNLLSSKDQQTGLSSLPRSCADLRKNGKTTSGVHRIQPKDNPIFVNCDMETLEGGWTIIQNRYSGDVDFQRDWDEYKLGFGNILGEFWLGLKYIHELTESDINELLIELEDFENVKVDAYYSAFALGSEEEMYSLKILGNYSGSAGDSLSAHGGMKYSTLDNDNDSSFENCAEKLNGAWWFKDCGSSNLNGLYLKGLVNRDFRRKGMWWEKFHGPNYSLKSSTIKIRPKN